MRFLMRLALASTIALAAGQALADNKGPINYVRPEAKAFARPQYVGHVYLLRGFGDVFSRGLDDLGRKLRKRGVKVQVISHAKWAIAADKIIADRKKHGMKPVVLIGHSLGANAAILMAKRLRAQDILVAYLVTFAATAPDPVPDNVGRVDNYYFATNGWGERVVGDNGFRGEVDNKDFSGADDVGHFNIEKQPDIHEDVINGVLHYLKLPDRRRAD